MMKHSRLLGHEGTAFSVSGTETTVILAQKDDFGFLPLMIQEDELKIDHSPKYTIKLSNLQKKYR